MTNIAPTPENEKDPNVGNTAPKSMPSSPNDLQEYNSSPKVPLALLLVSLFLSVVAVFVSGVAVFLSLVAVFNVSFLMSGIGVAASVIAIRFGHKAVRVTKGGSDGAYWVGLVTGYLALVWTLIAVFVSMFMGFVSRITI